MYEYVVLNRLCWPGHWMQFPSWSARKKELPIRQWKSPGSSPTENETSLGKHGQNHGFYLKKKSFVFVLFPFYAKTLLKLWVTIAIQVATVPSNSSTKRPAVSPPGSPRRSARWAKTTWLRKGTTCEASCRTRWKTAAKDRSLVTWWLESIGIRWNDFRMWPWDGMSWMRKAKLLCLNLVLWKSNVIFLCAHTLRYSIATRVVQSSMRKLLIAWKLWRIWLTGSGNIAYPIVYDQLISIDFCFHSVILWANRWCSFSPRRFQAVAGALHHLDRARPEFPSQTPSFTAETLRGLSNLFRFQRGTCRQIFEAKIEMFHIGPCRSGPMSSGMWAEQDPKMDSLRKHSNGKSPGNEGF